MHWKVPEMQLTCVGLVLVCAIQVVGVADECNLSHGQNDTINLRSVAMGSIKDRRIQDFGDVVEYRRRHIGQ